MRSESQQEVGFIAQLRQWVVIGKSIYTFQHLTVFSYDPITQLTNFLWDFLNAATIWFCTWLGLFYCMKIANLTHPVFLWLKYKVPAWIPWMQVGAVGFSGLNSILCFIGNQIIYQDYVRSDWQFGNATEYIPRNSFEKFYFFSLNLIMWTIPSALFLLFMVLVLTSLGRHMKKSLLNTPGFQDSQIQAPTRSLLALFSFVVLFTSCFLSLVLSSANSFSPQKLWYWVWQAVIHLCTGIHTTILLFINPSLREILERGCSLRCGSP
ncbi:PREDICTED: taste receptor type 2 member 135 [Dipodomys ordii]|uniref:Taste receptor type 2 n=1 Tax=Dipodomys ordii TaxID=10020 RepID=A0A1S3FMD5_DIPOR|nr:PREDICTED: taste receptor type 2 member 135 [Dipodomys ordii]